MAEQTSADNLGEFEGKGEERGHHASNTCPCFHGRLGCLCSVSLSHVPTFSSCFLKVKQGLLKPGAHFPLESIHCVSFAFFCLCCCQGSQELLGSLLAPRCVNKLQARVPSGKNASGVDGAVLNACGESRWHLLLL